MKALLTWLASFRLRVLFRSAFLLLALAVLAMAITVLQEEKQRSYDNYRAGFTKTKEQIVARLYHPAGQLALLNPRWDAAAAAQGRPVLLPYSSIDFDDQNKVKNAIEMAGCLVRYPHDGSLCVAVGNNPWAGGFIYAAGTFASGSLQAHRIGDELLDGAHRLRVTVSARGQTYRWIAPFEPLPQQASLLNGGSAAEGVRGRFTGYVELPGRDYTGAKPVREFRGWVWQDGSCLEASDAQAIEHSTSSTQSVRPPIGSGAGSEPVEGQASDDTAACRKRAFFSLRLPVEVLRDALFQREKLVWPPADLDRFQVRVEVLPPGEEAALFDSAQPGAAPPFALNDLGALLQPGETLTLRKAGQNAKDMIQLAGKDEALEQSSPLITRLIRRLPVESLEAPVVELGDEIATPLGNYQLQLKGDARSVNKTLSAVATRLSWFVGAMLGAIGLAWLVIEIGVIRRIAALTRRTRGLSKTVHADGGLESYQRYDWADLRGSDELGILASGLNDLLRRVKEDAERDTIRAEQEKDLWHAVGHEIMSPLQSLLALHSAEDDPSHRYISRMQQAVRVLYGSASPSEAFQSSSVHVQAIDIARFMHNVAENAGIADVRCVGLEEQAAQTVRVRADEFPLEDVFSHILKNADRYRTPDTPITLSLDCSETTATINIHNHGPQIAAELIDTIFEYGVSDQPEAGAHGNRGQGLFVAKTYMAKMGGTIAVRNVADGVSFGLSLQRM